MAANTNQEEEWLLQSVEESRQFNKHCSELVLGHRFIPPGDHHHLIVITTSKCDSG